VVDPDGAVVLLTRHRVDRVGIERGDGPVVDTLLAAGLELVVISSRQVRALRLRYGTGNKTRPTTPLLDHHIAAAG
jgi:hypothetical protein